MIKLVSIYIEHAVSFVHTFGTWWWWCCWCFWRRRRWWCRFVTLCTSAPYSLATPFLSLWITAASYGFFFKSFCFLLLAFWFRFISTFSFESWCVSRRFTPKHHLFRFTKNMTNKINCWMCVFCFFLVSAGFFVVVVACLIMHFCGYTTNRGSWHKDMGIRFDSLKCFYFEFLFRAAWFVFAFTRND